MLIRLIKLTKEEKTWVTGIRNETGKKKKDLSDIRRIMEYYNELHTRIVDNLDEMNKSHKKNTQTTTTFLIWNAAYLIRKWIYN